MNTSAALNGLLYGEAIGLPLCVQVKTLLDKIKLNNYLFCLFCFNIISPCESLMIWRRELSFGSYPIVYLWQPINNNWFSEFI